MLDWYLELPQAKWKKSYAKDVERSKFLRNFFGKLEPVRITPEKVEEQISEGRPIPIDPRLDEVLAALPRSMHHPELVFTRDGKPINDIRWWHNKTCREAKIEDFWFHDFRHTCITNWRRRGVDFITLMKATGHKTLSMFHRYNAVGDDGLRALVGKTKIDSQNLVNSAT